MCKICRHPENADIILAYARLGSLRLTAASYGVNYRTLQRFLDKCLYKIVMQDEQLRYERAFAEAAQGLRAYYGFMALNKPRPKRIITKPVTYTWSRRSWKKAPNEGRKSA